MNFTNEEKSFINACMEKHIKNLIEFADKYPDGGWSGEALQKEKAIMHGIINKLNN